MTRIPYQMAIRMKMPVDTGFSQFWMRSYLSSSTYPASVSSPVHKAEPRSVHSEKGTRCVPAMPAGSATTVRTAEEQKAGQ